MTAPTPNSLAHDLLEAIVTHEMLPDAPTGGKVALVVAVSGGLDSVCLGHLLHSQTPRLPIELHLAHVDHGLRPESAVDAAFVVQLAAAWNTPFHQTRLDPAALRADPAGLEAAARQARYAFLRRVAREVARDGQTSVIATAHHADDQAETVLLRLITGSGVHGLAGMRWVTEWPADEIVNAPVRIVRPLLGVRRSQLLAYASRVGLSWREDATNQDTTFPRNRLRHLALPQLELINPAAVESICRGAEMLAGVAQQVAGMDENLLAALTLESEPGQRVVFDLERLRCISPPQVRSLVHSAIRRTFPHLRDLNFAHVGQIEAAAREERSTGGSHPVVGRLHWSRGRAPRGLGERESGPLWLSLHDQCALPVHPAHPFLHGVEWGERFVALPQQGDLIVSDEWVLHVEQDTLADHDIAPFSRDPWQAWLDADRCGELHLTAPAPGMRIAALGLNGGRKTIGDLFTDRKLPAALRGGWPLVVDAQTREVVWVCGLTISERVALRMSSRRALHLRWQPGQG